MLCVMRNRGGPSASHRHRAVRCGYVWGRPWSVAVTGSWVNPGQSDELRLASNSPNLDPEQLTQQNR